MATKGVPKSEEHKRKISEGVKRQHAEGRGNPSGILSKEARKKAAITHTGHTHTPKGEKHWNWKGDGAAYSTVHLWLRDHYKKKGICEHCLKEKITEWANIEGNYTRNREDYLELCRSCHKKYDMTEERKKKISKSLMGNVPWNKGKIKNMSHGKITKLT